MKNLIKNPSANEHFMHWCFSSSEHDLENYFKSSEGGGFLSGRAAGPTIGSSGSIGAIFLDVLSSLMRETHNSNNIWWN